MRAVRGAAMAALFVFLGNACGSGGGQALQFVLPADGTVVDEPLVLAVTGTGISRATFDIDGTVVGDVATAPFEWTLDATAYSGDHVVTIVAHLDDGEHAMSATLTFTGVVFLTPTDGSVVTTPTALAVEGATVTSVDFRLDGTRMLLDTDAPFSWILDPDAVSEGDHEIVIDAFVGALSRSKSLDLRTVKPSGEPPPPPDVLAAIQALKPGEWYEIPDTELRDVQPDPPLPGGTIGGLMAWSSGAYDTKRDRLIVWGGGHGDYSGNEIYAFSMKSFQWKRVNEPSEFPPGEGQNPLNKPQHPDGAPISRHTYDYLEYIPAVDRFFSGGGAALWWTGQFDDETTYLFNFDTLEWTHHGNCPSRGIGATSALGPDGRVWMHGSYGQHAVLAAFDGATSVWTKYALFDDWIGYGRTAEIDPVENKYVLMGEDQVRIWDLSKPNEQHVVASFTGTAPTGDTFVYPGVAFDPKTEKLVVWGGGATVYSFDVGTLHWTAHATAGVNTTPPAAAATGTNGRWRYVPSLGVFVVMNSVSRNVFVYRHS
jgi:Bacterial Ig domain